MYSSSCFILNLPYMIKTNDTTYNIAKSVKCLVIKSHLSLILKEDKVAFNEYLKIFIHHYKNMFYIYKKIYIYIFPFIYRRYRSPI